jgi:hypothetical protein
VGAVVAPDPLSPQPPLPIQYENPLNINYYYLF